MLDRNLKLENSFFLLAWWISNYWLKRFIIYHYGVPCHTQPPCFALLTKISAIRFVLHVLSTGEFISVSFGKRFDWGRDRPSVLRVSYFCLYVCCRGLPGERKTYGISGIYFLHSFMCLFVVSKDEIRLILCMYARTKYMYPTVRVYAYKSV